MVMQQLNWQSPAVAVRRGAQAEAKNQLPYPAAQPGGPLAVTHNFLKELISQRLALLFLVIHKPLPSDK